MAKIEKSPALPFYGKDFFDDERVKYLTLAGWGLYVALLWRQWSEGSIPADVTKIAAVLGRPEKEVRAAWDSGVSIFFAEIEPDRLANQKLERVRAEMLSVRAKRSMSAYKRHANADSLHDHVTPMQNADGEKIDSHSEFESIWMDVIQCRVPEPVGKKGAQKSFESSVRTADDLAAIRIALNNYRGSDRVRRGFVQNASTWFNNWRDWVNVTPAKPASPDGVAIERTPKDELRERFDPFINKFGSRPPVEAPRRSIWDREFTDRFGFTPDEYIDATPEQCAEWLSALKVEA